MVGKQRWRRNGPKEAQKAQKRKRVGEWKIESGKGPGAVVGGESGFEEMFLPGLGIWATRLSVPVSLDAQADFASR
jgi:hypothetical protein